MENPAEQERFRNLPWGILEGDTVGFTAITDPLWPKLEAFLWEWLERASEVAKLTTLVTKWPVSRQVMAKLAEYPKLRLNVTITGNAKLEKVPMRKHLRTLELAKEFGVKALPISHPYISGVSDLWFLPEIKKLGYDHFDVKGFRYCDARMGSWMPEASKSHYLGREEEEILPEDGWREKVELAGLTLLSPRQWYQREAAGKGPHLDRPTAEKNVMRLFELANIVSSNASGVFQAAVERRL